MQERMARTRRLDRSLFRSTLHTTGGGDSNECQIEVGAGSFTFSTVATAHGMYSVSEEFLVYRSQGPSGGRLLGWKLLYWLSGEWSGLE
jgi:hypothetical protein